MWSVVTTKAGFFGTLWLQEISLETSLVDCYRWSYLKLVLLSNRAVPLTAASLILSQPTTWDGDDCSLEINETTNLPDNIPSWGAVADTFSALFIPLPESLLEAFVGSIWRELYSMSWWQICMFTTKLFMRRHMLLQWRRLRHESQLISRFYQRRLHCMQTANRFSAFLGLILKVGKTWTRWYFCSLALCDQTPWRNIHTSLNTSLTIKKSLKPSDQSSLSTALFPKQ